MFKITLSQKDLPKILECDKETFSIMVTKTDEKMVPLQFQVQFNDVKDYSSCSKKIYEKIYEERRTKIN